MDRMGDVRRARARPLDDPVRDRLALPEEPVIGAGRVERPLRRAAVQRPARRLDHAGLDDHGLDPERRQLLRQGPRRDPPARTCSRSRSSRRSRRRDRRPKKRSPPGRSPRPACAAGRPASRRSCRTRWLRTRRGSRRSEQSSTQPRRPMPPLLTSPKTPPDSRTTVSTASSMLARSVRSSCRGWSSTPRSSAAFSTCAVCAGSRSVGVDAEPLARQGAAPSRDRGRSSCRSRSRGRRRRRRGPCCSDSLVRHQPRSGRDSASRAAMCRATRSGCSSGPKWPHSVLGSRIGSTLGRCSSQILERLQERRMLRAHEHHGRLDRRDAVERQRPDAAVVVGQRRLLQQAAGRSWGCAEGPCSGPHCFGRSIVARIR